MFVTPKPKVSIIVPNHNHARFLPQRVAKPYRLFFCSGLVLSVGAPCRRPRTRRGLLCPLSPSSGLYQLHRERWAIEMLAPRVPILTHVHQLEFVFSTESESA